MTRSSQRSPASTRPTAIAITTRPANGPRSIRCKMASRLRQHSGYKTLHPAPGLFPITYFSSVISLGESLFNVRAFHRCESQCL
uniref:Uncharacterized protein n=1 Tax=Panagrellus redivivus TaxID=6233 RepID=A0A7E4V3N6_PANRE